MRPAAGLALSALAPILRRLPGVRSVDVEHRAALRFTPNDPALSAAETAPGTPAGTTVAWWVPRIGLPAAWDVARGDGATVAVIDTGADSGHPDLQGKIAEGDRQRRHHRPRPADERRERPRHARRLARLRRGRQRRWAASAPA